MGQKTNSNILRLGLKKKEWNSKYIEKQAEELSFYVYNDLEIKKYLDRFFQLHGLILHDCKINYSSNSIDVFVSYFATKRALKSQNFKSKKKATTLSNKRDSDFVEILLESLTQFTNKKINISFTFQNLNGMFSLKFTKRQVFLLRNIKLQLSQFSRSVFFKEAITLLSVVVQKRQSSKLLAQFIAFQFSVTKRHNFFLVFLKQALTLMLRSSVSKVLGLKIIISGRFNGAPRARSNIIQIGSVPLQSFKSRISHAQSTAYTPNGTFGIKVWICES